MNQVEQNISHQSRLTGSFGLQQGYLRRLRLGPLVPGRYPSEFGSDERIRPVGVQLERESMAEKVMSGFHPSRIPIFTKLENDFAVGKWFTFVPAFGGVEGSGLGMASRRGMGEQWEGKVAEGG
ncbi:hypothetical protein LINPERPRIM_LOCUS11542 [Linum perenne]